MIVPDNPVATEYGAAERTRAAAAQDELRTYVQQLAGTRGHAVVVVDDDPAMAIVQAASDDAVDVLVVGNAGMAGRKEFLLGNVPNRISAQRPLHGDHRQHDRRDGRTGAHQVMSPAVARAAAEVRSPSRA